MCCISYDLFINFDGKMENQLTNYLYSMSKIDYMSLPLSFSLYVCACSFNIRIS